MKKSVNFSQFCDAFRDMGRNENFSYEGKKVLFEYLEQYEDDTGEEIELDVIALCCEYSEMTIDEVIDYYRIDVSKCDDDDDKEDVVREYLENHTSVVGEVSGGFVFAEF